MEFFNIEKFKDQFCFSFFSNSKNLATTLPAIAVMMDLSTEKKPAAETIEAPLSRDIKLSYTLNWV